MTYRDIIVSMDTAASAPSCAAFAADFAVRFGAQLIGAFARGQLTDPFMPPDVVAWLPADDIQRIYDQHAQMVDRLAENARMTFESAAADREVVSDWRVLKDSDELVASARHADLLILGAQKGQLDAYAPASIAIEAGGPAIIVPAGKAKADFRRVLVAWNGGSEAARALHAAWPILAAADRVDVLIVSPDGLRGSEGALQRHFERHGIKPNITIDESEDFAAGTILHRQVEAMSPDLVVMGLYGRTRMYELIMGGVSREMLSEPRIPLFVHH
jgi:nucleotide-binding universal stress UspA family protein